MIIRESIVSSITYISNDVTVSVNTTFLVTGWTVVTAETADVTNCPLWILSG